MTTTTSDGEFNDFFSEVNDIYRGNEPEGDTGSSEDELEPKTTDEAEQAAEWLESAGYGSLVGQVLGGEEVDDVFETATLTKAQKITVKKRINTLKSTLSKKRQRQAGKTDVRDVFSQKELPSGQTMSVPMRPGRPSSRSSRGSVGIETHSAPQGSPPSAQWMKRNVSIHARREYNMDPFPNSLHHSDIGVEMLSIQPKTDLYRVRSDSDENRLFSDPTPFSASETEIAMSLESSNQALLRRPKSPRSPISPRPFYLSSAPPPSPMSFSSSSSSTSPASNRMSINYLDGLPPIAVQADSLGVTRIDDLSPSDVSNLRPLLVLELTTLFDQYHIEYTKRKGKKKYKDSGIFGVPLQTLLEYDQKNHKDPCLKVPKIFQQLIGFLDKEAVMEEGILRVPGSVLRIKSLRQELNEKFNSKTFEWEEVRPNDAAGLLKQFLRELPSPLLTFDYLEAFAQVENIPSLEDQIQALKLLVLLLPEVNRYTLQMLLRFLRRVVVAENKMTVHNVAMIMAPNLFLVQSSRNSKGINDSEFRMAAGTSNIVRIMMHYQDLLWIVPSTMVTQMRHQNEAEQNRKSKSDKSIIKLLGRKEKTDAYRKPSINNEADVSRGVIRVQVPMMTKCHTAIQLDATMTAADIVTRCLLDVAGPQSHTPLPSPTPPGLGGLIGRGLVNGRQDSTEELEESLGSGVDLKQAALFEIGGNIGERRLDGETRVLEVLGLNPNAEWVIRYNVQH